MPKSIKPIVLEAGRWYWIDYKAKVKKESFTGPAKLLYHVNKGYVFWSPLGDDKSRHMFFNTKDIVKETQPLPSYQDLMVALAD